MKLPYLSHLEPPSRSLFSVPDHFREFYTWSNVIFFIFSQIFVRWTHTQYVSVFCSVWNTYEDGSSFSLRCRALASSLSMMGTILAFPTSIACQDVERALLQVWISPLWSRQDAIERIFGPLRSFSLRYRTHSSFYTRTDTLRRDFRLASYGPDTLLIRRPATFLLVKEFPGCSKCRHTLTTPPLMNSGVQLLTVVIKTRHQSLPYSCFVPLCQLLLSICAATKTKTHLRPEPPRIDYEIRRTWAPAHPLRLSRTWARLRPRCWVHYFSFEWWRRKRLRLRRRLQSCRRVRIRVRVKQ
jgi:hypothetical protein